MKTITSILTKPDYTLNVTFGVGYFGSIPNKIEPSGEGALILEVKHPMAWVDERVEGFVGQEEEGLLAEPGKWPDPPHFALANWQFDSAKSVCIFVERYGVPLFKGQVPKVVYPSDLRVYQGALRAAWRTTSGKVSAHEANEAVEVLQKELGLQEIQNPWSKANHIILHEPWSLSCFLFLSDLAEGKLAICSNPNCANPYFIKARSDQQFCSIECRNLVNVQRWRSVPKNRKRERVARKKRGEKR